MIAPLNCLYAIISGQDSRHTGSRLNSITCIGKKGGNIMFSKVKETSKVKKRSLFGQNRFERFQSQLLSVLKLVVPEFDVLTVPSA